MALALSLKMRIKRLEQVASPRLNRAELMRSLRLARLAMSPAEVAAHKDAFDARALASLDESDEPYGTEAAAVQAMRRRRGGRLLANQSINERASNA